MSNHSLTLDRTRGLWLSRCACGAHSDPVEHRWQAEDWSTEHLHQVARARAHLRNRDPSLTDQWKWYTKQAKLAPDTRTAASWAMLASGLEHRIGHPVEETPLFEEDE